LVDEGRMGDGTRVGTGSEKTRASSRPKCPSMHQNPRESTTHDIFGNQRPRYLPSINMARYVRGTDFLVLTEEAANPRPADTLPLSP
jgi:hypothetical protein